MWFLWEGTRSFPCIGQTKGQLLPHSLNTRTNSNIRPRKGALVISTLVFNRLLKTVEQSCLEIVILEIEEMHFNWLTNLGLAIPFPRVEISLQESKLRIRLLCTLDLKKKMLWVDKNKKTQLTQIITLLYVGSWRGEL